MLSARSRTTTFVAGLLGLFLLTGPAIAAPDDTVPGRPSFHRHIVPLFSRLGCNAGSCHGAVKGQNGFKLSLFGVDPAADHRSLLREFGGRRVNFADPENSLLLLKAIARVPHQGGLRTTVTRLDKNHGQLH